MCSQKLISSDVFRPCNFPEHTYITRESKDGIDYEQRLKLALNISGTLISIIGASKMGKTVLCEKVIPLERQVNVSGADFSNGEDFWHVISQKVGLPLGGQITEKKQISDTEQHSKTEMFTLTKDRVIKYFVDNNKVLILDDFHYASDESQKSIASHLKDAIRRDFRAIIISLPHRADAPIRKNADLVGRLSLIDIETWKISELKEIAIKGFNELDIKISEDIANDIAVESLTSPQLMQYICLSICTLLDTDNGETKEITSDILEKAYKFTTSNLDYRDVLTLISRGPLSKGKKRSKFTTKSGEEMDLYQLVVESLAENPPLMGLTIDDIKDRVNKLITDTNNNPDRQKVKNTVTQIQKLINDKDDIYKVLEWKDEMIYIIDPLFLFYLRWGR
ncbi:AAA family ATPase [Clostridium uliginosum]|uniref:AAA domain-containing protein n=1 Tax=Clostridium uliginosum TaxID=119641 RepID=A0A1I1IXD7_9CLOT|nr:AAA family ATPase [Clostridium uliginosum]SFC38998.1 AAA domain-containing protein [Clostridium uliginosum]